MFTKLTMKGVLWGWWWEILNKEKVFAGKKQLIGWLFSITLIFYRFSLISQVIT